MVAISGKTYDWRSILKNYGARWVARDNVWVMTEERWNDLVSECVHGRNKRDRERNEAIRSWTVEPATEDQIEAVAD